MPDDLSLIEAIALPDAERAHSFARELTNLSIKWRIGIAQPFTLFLMECDDYDRRYVLRDSDAEFV